LIKKSAKKKYSFIFKSLERPEDAKFEFRGFMGERIDMNLKHWLLIAPKENPLMFDMFKQEERDRNTVNTGQPSDLQWFSGEFAGKYLISAIQSFQITHDEDLKNTIEKYVNQLISCQAEDGYLGPFSGINKMHWWDLWGQYHCMLGLYLWYREDIDKNEYALDACIKAADLFCNTYLGTGNRVAYAMENFEEMNEACIHIFTLLYQDPNPKVDYGGRREKYLTMIREIEKDWQLPDCRSGDYVNFFQDGEMFYNCRKPRWESLHNVQAIAELYFKFGNKKYQNAFIQIWSSIAKGNLKSTGMFPILAGDRHNTGGFSSFEYATGNPYDPRPIETCATIAWMALTVDMLRLKGDSLSADELELSTWNAILAAQSIDGKWWTYNTPMGGIPTIGMGDMGYIARPLAGNSPAFEGVRNPSTYINTDKDDLGWQVKRDDPTRGQHLSCCSTNGPRGIGILSEWAVMISKNGIALNYYGPSKFTVHTPSGQEVSLEQETKYPFDVDDQSKITVTMMLNKSESFELKLRIPAWSNKAETEVKINGARPNGEIIPGTYLPLNREWNSGDQIEVKLSMKHRFIGGELPPANSKGEGSAVGRVAIYRGPLLLAYDKRFDENKYDPRELPFIDLDENKQPTVEIKESLPQLLVKFDTLGSGKTITLCDFASAGATADPYATDKPSYVSWLPTIEKMWHFARLDRSVIAKRIRLQPDKTIEGANPFNESTWGFENGTLVFYYKDGRPSTRFASIFIYPPSLKRDEGRIVYSGEFLGTPPGITHVLTEIDWGATNKRWQFERCRRTKDSNGCGEVEEIAKEIRLVSNPEKAIENTGHPNESTWDFDESTLIFIHRNGKTRTTCFTKDKTDNNGKIILEGQFLLDPNITHILNEKDISETPIFWDPAQPYVSFNIES